MKCNICPRIDCHQDTPSAQFCYYTWACSHFITISIIYYRFMNKQRPPIFEQQILSCSCFNIKIWAYTNKTIIHHPFVTSADIKFCKSKGQIVCRISIMPFSNVVISNQLTGITGRREVEENHLNLQPCHGSPAAEGGQGCRPGWQLGSILRSRWRIVQWGGTQGESQGGVRVGRPPRSASFEVNCAECWDEEVYECGGN